MFAQSHTRQDGENWYGHLYPKHSLYLNSQEINYGCSQLTSYRKKKFQLTGLQLTDPKATSWRPTGAPPILHVVCKTANPGASVTDLTLDAANLSSMD